MKRTNPNPVVAASVLILSVAASCSHPVPGSAAAPGESEVHSNLVRQFREVLAGTDAAPIPPPPAMPPALVELGRQLFHEVEISGERDVSCATCHIAELAGADGRTLPAGVGGSGLGPDRSGGFVIPRNSPGLFNLHLQDVAFWDGRVERSHDGTLTTPAGTQLTAAMQSAFPAGLEVIAAQAMFPPTSRHEMRGELGRSDLGQLADDDFTGIWSAIMERLLSFPTYTALFADAFPGTSLQDLTFAHAGAALAAFEVVEFYRPDSRFQSFLGGDDAALSNEELRGGIEFYGVAGCASCHRGPILSDMRFHNIGMPQLGPGKGDGADENDDFGRMRVTGDTADWYAFRTPALVGIKDSAPFGHAGQFKTLRRTVTHYRDVHASIQRFRIDEEVLDPALIGTLVPNELEILEHLSPLTSRPIDFDVDAVTAFLEAL